MRGHIGHLTLIIEQIFFAPTHGRFTCNLASIGQWLQMLFEKVDNWWWTDNAMRSNRETVKLGVIG